MSIEVNCKHCGSVHQVNDRMAGRSLRCPHCDSPVDVASLAEVMATPVEIVELTEDHLAHTSDPGSLTGESGDATSFAMSGTASDRVLAADRRSVNGTQTDDAQPTPDADDDDDVLPARVNSDDGELDMTPMVDVTFLLLIFFMITAAFSLQKSIESPRQTSDKPSSAAPTEEPEELDMVTVQINEFGSFLVMAPDWERETPGKQNLIRALREAMGTGETAMKLVIEVHEMAKLKSLVDCMDAGTICDYGEMQVLQVEGFE